MGGKPRIPSRATRWVGTLGLATLALGWAVVAAELKAPAPRVLFDGKSLAGWEKTDFVASGEVKVVDGELRLEQGGGMTGVTTTHKDIPTSDYELVYEAKRVSGDDFFAAATFPVDKGFVTLVNGGWRGSVTGISSIDGADASENETGNTFHFKNDIWYRFRVHVTKSVVRCWIDKEQVVDLDHRDRHLATRIETRVNQPLGFATWESGGAIRRVEIRPLTAEEIAALKPRDD